MQAPLLPEGYQTSAWPDLDAAARSLLVEEFLILNLDLEQVGDIDFESPREPIFKDRISGKWVSLAGDSFTINEPLTVTVSPGGFLNRSTEGALLAAAMILGVIIIARL